MANNENITLHLTVHGSLRGMGYTTLSHSACADERLDAELLGVLAYAWHRLIYAGTLTERDLDERFGIRLATRALRRLEQLGYAAQTDVGLNIEQIADGRAVLL
ncbi:hypothetical protein QOL99_11855 [Deinococcus sp. MIMF12]|uniref:MarR family transcriptional regulator n=1 Tax=Deinococcus rhizophilus TaxID=3049544 RepID=A0ABT7JIE9_9DEIO|nr:hypothetical protein [Deinococcus rhizophilus]MDL2344841.1 hypothetical protein [Deinococcus rhizophilus]